MGYTHATTVTGKEVDQVAMTAKDLLRDRA